MFFDTYRRGLPYRIVAVEPIWIRSNRCRGGVLNMDGILTCTVCSSFSVDFDLLKERAGRSFENLRIGDLTKRQSRDKLSALQHDLNPLKLKTLDMNGLLNVAHRDLADYQTIVQFMGTAHIPRPPSDSCERGQGSYGKARATSNHLSFPSSYHHAPSLTI